MLRGGCWIFLSHSSHDIEKVHLVRNEFERLGHNPLAFHLKCLSTDTEEGQHELDSLITRNRQSYRRRHAEKAGCAACNRPE